MKATGFVQISPKRNARGEVRELRVGGLTKTYPRSPEPGALVVRLELDVDPAVFDTPTVTVALSGDRSAASAAVVPVPVPQHVIEDVPVVGVVEDGVE